jgi:hypothetical protein
MSDPDLSPAEIELLRAHGIVLYESRVIFEAQPPITAEALARVQAKCIGPIPQPLLDLWSITAGGFIDYDVSIELDGGRHGFSWTELFYEGATTYFDLPGWIGRELENLEEACEESGEPFPGLLSWLPIGGFEYLDRVYVCVRPGDEYGSVAFWMRGLPPAWTHRLHVSSTATAATSVPEAFALLHLEVDPRVDYDDYRHGTEFLDYLNERVTKHGMSIELADRITNTYARALINWQSMLDDGSILVSENAISAAFGHAISQDDPAVVRRMWELGERYDTPLSGTGVAVDVALRAGAYQVLHELLRVNATVPVDVFQNIVSVLPSELAMTLLERGAQPTYDSAATAVACGAFDAARVMAKAVPGLGLRRKANFAKALEAQSLELRRKLAEVQAGKLHHYLGEDGLQERIDRLSTFSLDGEPNR